jgi:PAS domain S-box-containing protein
VHNGGAKPPGPMAGTGSLESGHMDHPGGASHTPMNGQLLMVALGGAALGAVAAALMLGRRLRRESRALADTEGRYRALFEAAPIAIAEVDLGGVGRWFDELRARGVTDLRPWLAVNQNALAEAAGKVIARDVNETAVRLWEAPSKQELRADFPRLLARSCGTVFAEGLISLWAGQTQFAGVLHGVSCKGNHVSLLMTWSGLERESQLDLARIMVGFVDIGDVERTRAELEAEREQLAVTLESIKEAVITVDDGGRVAAMNLMATQLTGVDPFEALGRAFADVLPLQIEPAGTDPVRVVLAGGPAVELISGCRLARADGRDRELEVVVAPMAGRDGKRVGAVVVARDVTERRKMERETINASKLESIALLAGGMAHDFNNVLTAMMNGLYVLKLGNLPAASAEAAGEMEGAVLKAREIARQLLVFARGGTPRKENTDLGPLLRDAGRFALVGSNVDADYDLQSGLWTVEADPAQIAQVVQNIVLNARQAMPSGGRVRVSARNDPGGPVGRLPGGSHVRVAIKDTGPGISASAMKRVFEPFFSTKPGSTGVGLTAAKSIVERHGGTIEVDSEPGGGTEIVFWLPASERPRSRPAEVAGAPEEGSGRVLFIEDEEAVRILAVRVLRAIGYQVHPAREGGEAVELYREALERGARFDVVIADLTIRGGMGAVETLGHLRALDPEARVIVSSGYAADPVLAAFREHGFDAAIEKPYEVTRLATTLREVLSGESR